MEICETRHKNRMIFFMWTSLHWNPQREGSPVMTWRSRQKYAVRIGKIFQVSRNHQIV